MSKQVLTIIWLACMIVSLGLFWVGLGQPYLHARALAEEPITLSNDPLTIADRAAREKAATPNYWIGAAAPVAILLGSLVLFARQPRKD